jgi:hypothetical protein
MQPFAQKLVVGGQAVLRAYKPKITYSKPKDTKKQFHDTLIVRSPSSPPTERIECKPAPQRPTNYSPRRTTAHMHLAARNIASSARKFLLAAVLFRRASRPDPHHGGREKTWYATAKGGGSGAHLLLPVFVLPPWPRFALLPCTRHLTDLYFLLPQLVTALAATAEVILTTQSLVRDMPPILSFPRPVLLLHILSLLLLLLHSHL